MPIRIETLGIDQLSVPDRLDLIEQIWDSLPEQVNPDEVSGVAFSRTPPAEVRG